MQFLPSARINEAIREANAEVGDLYTLDYNARPTIVPRLSTVLVGFFAHVFMTTCLPMTFAGFGTFDFLSVVCSLSIACLYNYVANCLLPNQIRITDNGISFGWNNLLFPGLTSPCISWSSIENATFRSSSAFEDSIDGTAILTINEQPKAGIHQYPYQFLKEGIWTVKELSFDYQLQILMSGITNNADKEFFAQQLVQKLPTGCVHMDVLKSVDARYPMPVVEKNAFNTSITFLDDFKRSRSQKSKLGERLELRAPRSISQASKLVALDYKPLRLIRPMLTAVERSGALTLTSVALPMAALGILHAARLLPSMLLVVISISIVPLLLAIITVLNPSTLTMTDSGIFLTWGRGLLKISPPGIPWSHVSYVGYTNPANNWAINKTVDFHIQTDTMTKLQRLFYFSLFEPLFFHRNHLRISFIESGLLFGNQSRMFHETLVRNLPPERIDPLLMEKFCPRAETSFTSLWLSSLNKERMRTEPLAPGDTIANGRYKVIKQIGAGGQGIAYEATCNDTGEETSQTVVLKEFIIPSHAGQTAQAKALESVNRECLLLQNIDHPFVVKMQDNFVEDHRFYLVLEHAEGKSLRSLINETGALSSQTTTELAIHLLSILCHLHSLNPPIIHRDFTPENIIVSSDGTPKLIDFNVARQSDSTATRTVVGKHSYLPPEQFRGKACPASDIYALGATLYFALTGEDPEPISASRPSEKCESVSKLLDEIVYRATQLSTDDRWQSAEQMREELLGKEAKSA